MLELADNLAAGPRFAHAVVLLFQSGEEDGLLGAHAAMAHHPWLTSGALRAVVNLEAMGLGGKAQLVRASGGARWLLRSFAANALDPRGTAFGNDVFGSGLVNSDTDSSVYAAVSACPTMDLVFLRNGAGHHTSALQRTAGGD